MVDWYFSVALRLITKPLCASHNGQGIRIIWRFAVGLLFGLVKTSSEVQAVLDARDMVECLVTAIFEVLGVGPFVQQGLRFAGLKVLQVLVLRGVTVQLASRSDVFCIWGLSLPLGLDIDPCTAKIHG